MTVINIIRKINEAAVIIVLALLSTFVVALDGDAGLCSDDAKGRPSGH